MFTKVLVANRGEIALRVLRCCREMGIRSVAVFSEADRTARHVLYADEAYCIGPAPSAESYLRIDTILEVAKKSGAQAIHPGYGFLAENGDFAEGCEQAGIVFIGPSSRAMRLLGSKTEARKTMMAAGVPVIPGMQAGAKDAAQALSEARVIGFPVMLKAAAGGGGKGMRSVEEEADFIAAFETARAEAGSAFGDPTVYVEKLVSHPRHIEFQVLADQYGHAVHLNERECSIQRRHQKLIEESPSAIMTPELRQRMGEVAVKAALASGYTNAGTVEFLVDDKRDFYFLEVNARLQVEHPVTELVTGLDLVKAQFLVAAGEPLELTQEQVPLRGSAIECRICAEDPYEDFFPCGGRVDSMIEPSGPGVRLESGLLQGQEISLFYDPLVAKLVCWGQDRDEAIARVKRALAEYEIQGVKTTIPFHEAVMRDDAFVKGDFDTSYVEERFAGLASTSRLAEVAAVLAAVIDHAGGPGRAGQAGGGLNGGGRPKATADPWVTSVRTSMMRSGRV